MSGKLNALNITEYNLIATKDPNGSYDRRTRENLYNIIAKLQDSRSRLTPLEFTLLQKFKGANFSALGEKDKKVKSEVLRYLLSAQVKRTLKLTAIGVTATASVLFFIYHLFLPAATRHQVDNMIYAGLNAVGLVSEEEVASIKENLNQTTATLQKTRKEYEELARVVDRMIQNNKVTENLKYIIKRIYDDSRTVYIKKTDTVEIKFGKNRIAKYKYNPESWYLLGVIETGMMKVYYEDEQIMEIETIFGRQGEETPVGEYAIKNRLHKPTWYKKEEIDGKIRVRAIPFGDPDHEIGHWWLGLKKLGDPVPGSYGIHGVNVNKANEFFKKNYDWRNGSAGCPNIQEWYLDFLAHVLPIGTHVNIVEKDKWIKSSLQAG
ncbi:MAG: L,D-transpeptidase family protein [Nitrospinaceae bacterium]|nr:L,D-transpeptidase [Nitrospinaceae bacterium]NIR54699.1 L,D-transpeptidase [Nitrospinaceae bacterium]NIS85120.1 L,D-transpeptidase [Nitrospinaceae bacterium]NIT81937.1 L,D-transpeptidase [Nitrospinaceae bacterium]NIU44198.1 L,D-transpeptidase [Nitrospinaceae bacterium]